MSERDLATAIYEMLSVNSTDAALACWTELADLPERERLERMLGMLAAAAIDRVLARRQREAARTGPWDAPSEEREACARHIEALAVAIRDNGPTTSEGLLTGIAGAQVGALLDAAALLRAGRGDAP